MADPSERPTLSPGQKRTHEGEVISSHTNNFPSPSSQFLQLSSVQRAPSPALSTTSSSLSELSSNAAPDPMAGSADPPAKKCKLTFAEKQVAAAEKLRRKEEKEKLKAEEQAKKDDEKRLKDVEKRKKAEEKEAAKKVKEVEKAQKDAERAEKQKVKDAEKADKDAQRAQKEAEKLKKERAQMRLGAFFGRPAPASTPPSTPDDVSSGLSSRRSSIASIDMEQPILDQKAIRIINPDFKNWILPFFPHDHTDVAPYNRFLTADQSNENSKWIDSLRDKPAVATTSLRHTFGPPKSRQRPVRPVKAIIDRLNGSERQPIDLTDDSDSRPTNRGVDQLSYKILSFKEDVRPPYQGTFTRSVPPRTARRLHRRPTARILPKVDYDYDSEAEWEAPEVDDEDLDDEEQMSDEEDGVDDMNDFLDDEDEIARRRITSSDVEPTCTGLCWEGEVDSTVDGVDLNLCRMDVLHDDTRMPIDPYSTVHWAVSTKTTPMKAKATSNADEPTAAMHPPRLPLMAVSAPNNSPLKKFITTTSTAQDGNEQKENAVPTGQKSKKPVKTIPPELLPAFKQAISGSDLNKVAIIEILKKEFPKCSKDAIKGSLEMVAIRQGAKEADKRWVLIA